LKERERFITIFEHFAKDSTFLGKREIIKIYEKDFNSLAFGKVL
jgi:hypothetical protein